LIIALICIFYFLGNILSLLSLVIPKDRGALVKNAVVAMVPVAFLICVLALTGIIGYWKMRKWGVWIYSGSVAINVASDILFKLRLSQIGIIQYGLMFSCIALGLFYFDRMT